MRVGVVGAGLQARRRVQAFKKLPDVEVVVISSEQAPSARSLASQMNAEAEVGWTWVSKRDDIDVVLVCTPPHLHAAISIAAMESGKHVLCEKPLARTIEEATRMLDAAKSTGRLLKCGFNHRHHPGISRAKVWLEEGKIGEPLFVRCRYGICGRPGYEHEWRADELIVGGGHLMEQGIHAVDLAQWFLGDFSEVQCFLSSYYWSTGNLEDNAFVLLRTEGGRVASIHSSLTQWKNLFSFEIFGRDGYLIVDGLGGSYGTQTLTFGKRDLTAPFSQEVFKFDGEDVSWLEEWREFTRSLREKRKPLGSAEEGVQAMRLVLAAYESARLRATIAVRVGQNA